MSDMVNDDNGHQLAVQRCGCPPRDLRRIKTKIKSKVVTVFYTLWSRATSPPLHLPPLPQGSPLLKLYEYSSCFSNIPGTLLSRSHCIGHRLSLECSAHKCPHSSHTLGLCSHVTFSRKLLEPPSFCEHSHLPPFIPLFLREYALLSKIITFGHRLVYLFFTYF